MNNSYENLSEMNIAHDCHSCNAMFKNTFENLPQFYFQLILK